MWILDSDSNKWLSREDRLLDDYYNFYKQELSSVRFYSKCLSGATYLPVNDLSNIYDVLTARPNRDWYISVNGSQYSNTLIPPRYATPITSTSSFDFYTRHLGEYDLTLKNLFTPYRLIKDTLKNYIYVDVATTQNLPDLTQFDDARVIDNIRLKNGHKVLVKNQITLITLSSTVDPEAYFKGDYQILQNFGATIEYQYLNEENGIYVYNDGLLQKTNELDDYKSCIRFSAIVKEGLVNIEKQFHLKRLKNGYFPSVLQVDPFIFEEKKNWILRNRVDYNNLFEINYYDILKHDPQVYNLLNFTYSVPQRTISVGEFGVIINYQNGVQNIINNKYKVNLRSISQTSKYYWICGDEGILLRVTKHDFTVDRIEVDCQCPRKLITTNLRSISFFDELNGAAVGDLNTILVTKDGGLNWERVKFEEFNRYYFNKVLYYSPTSFYVVGNTGIYLEFTRDLSGWSATKRRISRFIDEEEEYILVDNINDIFYTRMDNWGLTFSFSGQTSSNPKDLLFIVTDDSKIIVHDVNDSVANYDFLYLDFPKKYGDIRNITRQGTSSNFYFTGIDEITLDSGLFQFDINNFGYIGVGNTFSNTVYSSINPTFISDLYPNEIFDYNGQSLLLCGNESLLKSSTYSNPFDFQTIDNNFENRLKSKLLFLDYDVASKLNFFTDDGNYRLPQPVTFNFGAYDNYYLEFDQIVRGATAPSYATYSEHNWFEYWQDSNMTFEYYSQLPVTDNTKVLASAKFRYSSISTVVNISNLSIDSVSILPLAPKILEDVSSRFNGFGLTAISTPSISRDLYLYDFLMVVKLPLSFPVLVGDVFRLDSDVVSSNFIANKIVTFSGFNYVYFFTEFNENILNRLYTSTSAISLTNLNNFSSLNNLYDNFKLHPISQGYTLDLTERDAITDLKMNFVYGTSTASYTNWTFSPGFTTTGPVTNTVYNTNGVGEYFIETPSVSNVENISFYFSSNVNNYIPGTYSSITVQGLSGSNWESINFIIISDGAPGSVTTFVDFPTNYNYSKFKFVLRSSQTTVPSSPKNISLSELRFYSNVDLTIATSSFGTFSSTVDAVTIDSKFNNVTAYYNLATSVDTNYTSNNMEYRSGFLKFGYTPTYNLLDYLESINDFGDPNPPFFADKEYYSMPHYEAIPMPGISSMTTANAYIDYNGITYSGVPTNKLIFGDDLKLEWESLLVNTFVDIKLYDSPTYGAPSSVTERLLIINKYKIGTVGLVFGGNYTPDNESYVIEFDRSINLTLGDPLYFIDILSRRKLSQISEDLQILNNIQRLQNNQSYNTSVNSLYGANFQNFNRYYNFKINTDSYAKLMMADFETIDNLTAVLYTDYKNEFSMNITKLDKEFSIPILNTANFSGNLFISCLQKHELKTGDGVVLEFNGATGSSQELNPQYFGFHPVIVVNEYNFYIDIPYGAPTLVGNDSGFVKYVRKDPFLNYAPIDLIEYGVDKRGRQSIELLVENYKLAGDRFFLSNVDFDRFRFRLIDDLNLDILTLQYQWILEAEISGAIIGQDLNGLVWYKGTWECGRWFGGTWISGAWISGDWYDGNWFSKKIKDNFVTVDIEDKSSDNLQSTWFNGRWYNGTWNSGTWVNGRWYGGTWNTGEWYKGIWNDGVWNNGLFLGGIWIQGTWQRGMFSCDNEPAYWLDGSWNGGDFENGMWYNGTWQEKNTAARFGVKAYNSRTATWHGGKWLSGSFHSKVNLTSQGLHDVSVTHRYSIWKTGLWQSGDFYGGIAYNMDFKSGIWYGGILEDIQVIGFTGSISTSENYFTLNGIFKFNIGDQITLIDNQIGNTFSNDYGSNVNPQTYTVLYTVEDPSNQWTNVYVNRQILYNVLPPVDLGLRLVSNFRSCNWKSGIWTNGIYEAGTWEGGIWYNGVFGQNATWM